MLTLTEVAERVRARFPDGYVAASEYRGLTIIEVKLSVIVDACRFLKEEPELSFNFLVDLTAVDWKGQEPRFQLVYQLLSIPNNQRLTVITRVPESECHAPTMTVIWRGANWLEREVYDLMGIRFSGHPDLRRIVLPTEFKGHPLRKEFPLRGHDRS